MGSTFINKSIYIICLQMVVLTHVSFSQVDRLRKEISVLLKNENPVDFNLVPGILIGIIDRDSTFQLEFGRDIYAEGIYELGSLTKPVLAWLVNEALDSLRLDRTTSVCHFLPDSMCIGAWKNLTIEDVIGHRTGLLRMAHGIGEIESDIQDPYQGYSSDLLAHDLMLMEPTPGKYSYSHLGYALMFWLFEQLGGLPSFTEAKLSIPYSMSHTSWDVDAAEISPGYGFNGRLQPPWNTNALKPAIGLKSSLSDMLKFVRILFQEDDVNQNIQLSDSLKRELKSLEKAGEYKLVDGWFIIDSGKSLVYYHNGHTGGHHISVAFIPQLRKGVVVIANGVSGSNGLSLLILHMIRQSRSKISEN